MLIPALRAGALCLCFVLVACGGGGSGGDDIFSAEPADLMGLWSDAPEEDSVEATAVSRDVFVVIHDGGIDPDFPSGELRIVINVIETDGDTPGNQAQYMGVLELEDNALSARLNYYAGFPSVAPQPEFIVLSGVVVDSETLSFVLETESGAGADEFGTQDFFLSFDGETSPEVENPFLEFAGTFEAFGMIAEFLDSSYEFSVTFPSDTGEGFGVLAGDCDFDIKLKALGAEVRTAFARLRVSSCGDGDPFAQTTELFGYSLVIAPFDPENPFFIVTFGNDDMTAQLVGIRPVM